jgi:acetyl-CoA carboxylase/biotin carboxylase 1
MGIPTNNMATNGVKSANGAPSSNAAKYDLPSHFIGGNHLGVAPSSKVKDFVAAHGGHTVITNVSFLQHLASIGLELMWE